MKELLALSVSVCVVGLACAGSGSGDPVESVGSVSQAVEGVPPGCHMDCPKCRKGDPCPAQACVLVCPGKDKKVNCGDKQCNAGEYCCNESCSICAPIGGVCIQIACQPAPKGKQQCEADADCRLFSDYCTGCDCRALGSKDADPVCNGPGVRCFVDPCQGHTAACVKHTCTLQ